MSAITRRTNATASTAAESSTARRRVGASWLASAPTPTNTGITEHAASARYADGPAGSRASTSAAKHATHSSSPPIAIAMSAVTYAPRRLDDARQHKLAAAGVLLGSQRPHCGEHAPHGGEDRERPADAPRGVAADGQQVTGHAVEQPHRLVVAEAVREREPVGDRRIRRAVAGRLDVGDRGEQIREADRPDPPVGERAADERAGRTARRARADGARTVGAQLPRCPSEPS